MMEGSHNDSSQWELSKENIQPLKQGRKATVLSVVLDDNATQKLNITRHEFEEELRTYSGDDPLDVWYRYTLWVEQNYPKGGKDGKLRKLIEKCVMAVYTDTDLRDRYVNDPRFLDIWIKYANLSPNPIEMYQTMEAKCLCLALADFYINWAWEMEKTGNYRQANGIYEKGLQAGAKPFDILQESHKKFQIRVARSAIEGSLTEQEMPSSEPERVALTSLKSHGRRVPIDRVGTAVAGPAGRCHQDLPSRKTTGPAFSIFKDTPASVGSRNTPMNADQKDSLHLGASTNQENFRKPSQWTKAKVHQKTTGIVPLEDVDKYQKPKFSVHEDENADQPVGSQAILAPNSHVLSLHKEEDWHVQLFIAEPYNPKAQPQYCKNKVYCGTEEFSFEELRTAQYYKKEREEKEKVELQQLREMLKKKDELIQLLQNQLQENKMDILPKSSHILYQDSWVAINKSVTASINASNLLDESTSALLQVQPATANLSSKESSVSGDPTQPIAVNPCRQEQVNLSTSGNSRGLSFSDPTGDTKAAMNIMNDLFCTSLSNAEPQQQGIGLPEPPLRKASVFSIYKDDDENGQPHLEEKEAAPFQIFSDPVGDSGRTEALDKPKSSRVLQERTGRAIPSAVNECAPDMCENYPEEQDENQAPPGVVQHNEKRQFSGILQPSKGFPVLPEEEHLMQEINIGGNSNKDPEKVQNDNREKHDVSSMNPEDLDDIVPLDGRQFEDFTIKMPNNLETFTHMAKVVSTPVPWCQSLMPQASATNCDSTMAINETNNHFPLIKDDDDKSKKKNANGELMPPPSTTKSCATTNSVSVATTSLPYFEHETALSPIMEASQEYRSSSSSGCTTNTLHGHSVCGISQPGNFTLSTTHMSRTRHLSQADQELASESVPVTQAGDFTKSGYLADKSRGESLAESLPCIIGTAHQHLDKGQTLPFSSAAAAEMVMDFNDMMLSSEESKVHQAKSTDIKGKSVTQKDINPFDEKLLENILLELAEHIDQRGGFVSIKGNIPSFKANSQITLGKETFHIFNMSGEGAYAKAYRATTGNPLNVTVMPYESEEEVDELQVILKVQKPACPWEFYICHELRQRLKAGRHPTNVLESVMKIDRGYFFSNGSVLANKYHKFGTLLDAVNGCRAVGQTVPEEISMYFIVEVLTILEAVHSCNIIHADIKPDNFLIQDFKNINKMASSPSDIFAQGPVFLKLIDFGRSIDMNVFPAGTTFTEVVTTDKFTCCEMMEGQPWTYQTDYYGVAAIAHILLYGSYMEVVKTGCGKWSIKGHLKRYWKKDLWQQVFSTLLNVPSCSSLPNLSHLRQEIMTTFYEEGMHKDINTKFSLLKQNIMQLKK